MSTHPLRQFRERRGVSLDHLAQMVGTSKASLSRIETGGQTPSLALVGSLISASGGELSANDFLPLREEAKAQ
jgi:predicted transcriptional regulator